jgi:hypothetical protein
VKPRNADGWTNCLACSEGEADHLVDAGALTLDDVHEGEKALLTRATEVERK